MNAQQHNPSMKMIANLGANIFIPLTGDNEKPANVYNTLKSKGARVGFEHVKAMMDGRESHYKDFEVLTVMGHQEPKPQIQVRAAAVRAPMRVPTGPQSTKQQSSPTVVARGRGREYAPSGDIKALKRGTTYANIMEMLVQGATMKEMLEAAGNKTAGGVNDVLSWQIKQRGYGLRFEKETGKYILVFPKGHTKLTYKD